MTLATIWFSDDGFVPSKNGINGRRMAGNSFLNGYIKHTDAKVLRACSYNLDLMKNFLEFVEPKLGNRQSIAFKIDNEEQLKKTELLYYSGPSISMESWRRYPLGQAAYSICGITHTTATSAVMLQIQSILSAPIEPWDALICTSKSVHQSVEYQLEIAREYVNRRFDVNIKPRMPMLPIMPIGIECSDFKPSETERKKLRDQYNIADGDIVIGLIARLSPHEKFDPIPYFQAVRAAQKMTDKKLHLILCGEHQDGASKEVFHRGIRSILNVPVVILNGKKHSNRVRTLSASDIFSFPIDNIQETFGMSPIEAMAAGLPVITTDWNGMKDTVTEDVGFRVSTRMASKEFSAPESLRYQMNQDYFYQYLTMQTSVTEFDVQEMAQKIKLLAEDDALRKKMGQAAKKRAYELYDWGVIIPKMQELWDEQDAIRRNATQERNKYYEGFENPVAPRYTKLFSMYPSKQGIEDTEVFYTRPNAKSVQIDRIYEIRKYNSIGRKQFEAEYVKKIFAEVGDGSTIQDIVKKLGVQRLNAEAVLIWLLKFDLIGKKP